MFAKYTVTVFILGMTKLGQNEEGKFKDGHPSVFSKEETTNSSKQGSPANESEIIYQLSPGLLSLSPSE